MKEMLENKLIQDTFEGRVNRMCWWIKKWDAKKKKKKKEEENTWETILIQKISCIKVKIKKEKNSLKISIFQHL